MQHTQEENTENQYIRVSYKLLVWFGSVVIGGIMSIEATVLGVYFKQDARIATVEKDIKEVKDNHTAIRLDVDELKSHRGSVDAQLENLKPLIQLYGSYKQ